MKTKELSRLVDRGSESNAYHPTVHDFHVSGDEADISLDVLGHGTPTLGATWLAQTCSNRIAYWLQKSSASASFAFDSAIASAVIPEQVTLIFKEQDISPLSRWLSELLRAIDRLTSILESEPIEDGVSHAGESNVAEIIATYGANVFTAVILKTENLSLAAAMIRLLGRANPPARAVRHQLIEHGLGSESVEIRDAIVQAVELWEDQEGAHILRDHDEYISWLADYIQRVVNELEGIGK